MFCGRKENMQFDHLCANGQIAEINSPNGLTTQLATEGGGTDGNLALKK